jgi:hypothetical protein
MDGTGAPRKLQVNIYRVASTNSKRLELSILNHKNETLATVILTPDAIQELLIELSKLVVM